MSINDLKFHHPFTCVVAGMTSSGKTVFVRRLIKNFNILVKNIDAKQVTCLWCFKESSSIVTETMDNIKIINFCGIPTNEDIAKYKPNLIIVDDLMDDITEDVRNLFTRGSHHQNISIVLIVQNIFNKNKYMRTIGLNAHYIVLMKGFRIREQVSILGRQIGCPKLLDVFIDATKQPFGYLIVDSHPQQTDDKYRVRTRIFPEELPSSLAREHTFCPIIYDILGK